MARNEMAVTTRAENCKRCIDMRTYTDDGRIRQVEGISPHEAYVEEGKKTVMPGHGFPSMIEVYKMDFYLEHGFRAYVKNNTVPAEDRDRILEKYQLVFDKRLNRYTRNMEELWELFFKDHPRAIEEHITTYGQLRHYAYYRH